MLNDTTVTVGEVDMVHGVRFAPSETITITIDGDSVPLATLTDTPGGTFNTRITIPNVALGTHTVTATGSTGDSASATLTVVSSQNGQGQNGNGQGQNGNGQGQNGNGQGQNQNGDAMGVAPASGSSGLAFTGAEIGLMALAGAVLLMVGGMLVLTTRKRSAGA
jgi:hypothetical protein